MRLFLFNCFQILWLTLPAQFQHCDKLDNSLHYYPFSISGIKNTKDYIKSKHQNISNHFTSRNRLEKIALWGNDNDSFMLFKNENLEIEIYFGTKPVSPEKYFYPKEKNEKYSRIIYDQSAPYGLNSEDTLASCITRLLVNNVNCPSEAINDLLNVNRYYTFLSIKTPEVYISKNKKYIYLYLFGELKTQLMEIHDAVNMSFMAKLVFDRKGNYIERIVERGSVLSYFGFGDCPYFIGF
ncbi:MAG: hypothetical protein IPK61_05415 [Saprospiraceae bacterium]|nr:hypothetical protein [Saprospiraceae bacterium]